MQFQIALIATSMTLLGSAVLLQVSFVRVLCKNIVATHVDQRATDPCDQRATSILRATHVRPTCD